MLRMTFGHARGKKTQRVATEWRLLQIKFKAPKNNFLPNNVGKNLQRFPSRPPRKPQRGFVAASRWPNCANAGAQFLRWSAVSSRERKPRRIGSSFVTP